MGEQQHGLVTIAGALSHQHRHLGLDQAQLVAARNVAVIYDHELRPVDPFTEADLTHAPACDRAAHRHAPEVSLQWQIVDVQLPSGELVEAFETLQGGVLRLVI